MVFSHVNDGEMNLGETTTAAFTLFEEMGKRSYLGRDFLEVLWPRPKVARPDRGL